MAKFRSISTNFWRLPQVLGEFTPEDRYIYLYCLTNPHTNLCGCYEISVKQIAGETGLDRDVVRQTLARLQLIHRVVEYQPETKELLVFSWIRQNWTASPKLQRRILREIARTKCLGFRIFLRAECHRLKHEDDLAGKSGARGRHRAPPDRP